MTLINWIRPTEIFRIVLTADYSSWYAVTKIKNDMNPKLAALFRDTPKRVVQFDSKLHVYMGADLDGKIEADIKRALAHGVSVIENGVSRWIEHWPLLDVSKQGSALYIWAEDGNRVQCEKILFTKSPSGEVIKKRLGVSWRAATEVL